MSDPASRVADLIAPERKARISGAPADLAARDAEFIRSQLPLMWILATL